MTLPTRIIENEIDDIESIDFDINDLYERYIVPIELKRSISAPNILVSAANRSQNDGTTIAAQNDLNTAFVDNTGAQESRASAFYRMIGLPVLSATFDFYNPGFNPNPEASAKIKNSGIATNQDNNVLTMQVNRESEARKRYQIFQNSLSDSSVIALGQQYTKKFQVLAKTSFNSADPQKFTIPDRKGFIGTNYIFGNGSEILKFFDSGTHILRPFLNNPVIVKTVMPADRQICQPFLPTKRDTLLERNVYLDRPGIEFILRSRLSQKSNTALASNIITTLDPNQSVSGITSSDLERIGLALLNDNNISGVEILSSLKFGTVELTTVNDLIKLIKATIDEFIRSIDVVNETIRAIDWTPLPGLLGLIDAKSLVVSNVVSVKESSSELERQIKQLAIKASISANPNAQLSTTLGNYSLSYFEQTDKLFLDELNDAIEQKTQYIMNGANALRSIEIIGGEVSGLGLIDILAIYTALWSVDLDVLLSLLDTESFRRLTVNNKNLINDNVQKRINNGYLPILSITDAMTKFESQIINILDFADKLFLQGQAVTNIVDGGSSPTK